MEKNYEKSAMVYPYPGKVDSGPQMQPEYIAQANEFVNFLLAFDVNAQNEAFAHIYKRLIESRETRLMEIDQQMTNLKEQYENIVSALKTIYK